MTKNNKGGCLPAVLIFLSMIPLTIIYGATFMKLWEWYIADQFGVQEIGLPLAIGLTSIPAYITAKPPSDDDLESDHSMWYQFAKMWAFRITTSLVVLGEGLILTQWL